MDTGRGSARKARSGQTLVEYALVVAAMVTVATVAGLVGNRTNQLVNGASALLQKSAVPAPGTSVSASEGSISVDLSSVHEKDLGEGEDNK